MQNVRIVNATDLRRNLFRFLRSVAETGEPLYVTLGGRPIAVIVAYRESEQERSEA